MCSCKDESIRLTRNTSILNSDKKPRFQKILFIYNADSGLRNSIIDAAHKILSPTTYQCHLCDITYGVFTENSSWKNFRKKSAVEIDFLHKDEFQKQYGLAVRANHSFPVVLGMTKNGLEKLIDKEELSGLKKPDDLIRLIPH